MTSSMSFISQNQFNKVFWNIPAWKKCNPTLSRCHLWARTIFICRARACTGREVRVRQLHPRLVGGRFSFTKELSTHRPGSVNYLDFLLKILICSGNFLSVLEFIPKVILEFRFVHCCIQSQVIDKIPWSIFHTSFNVSLSSDLAQH